MYLVVQDICSPPSDIRTLLDLGKCCLRATVLKATWDENNGTSGVCDLLAWSLNALNVQWHLLLALHTSVPSWQCFISIATVLVFQKARGKLNIRQGVKFFLESKGPNSSLWKYLYDPHRQHTAGRAEELMHSIAVLLHWWRDTWAQIWTIIEWLGLLGTLKILLFQPSLGW